jgi:uncharacterized membrane protein
LSLLIIGLVVFLGVHCLPALPKIRAALATRLGEGRYKGLFSAVSALGLVLIVIGFAGAPSTERVFAPFPAAIAIAPYAVTLAIILLAAANMRGYIRQRLRHPMLLGILIWASVHLLANGDLRGTVLFGGFLAYAAIDLVSATKRQAVKVFVPSIKFDVMAIVGGIAVAVAIMVFHRLLFGVPAVSFGV